MEFERAIDREMFLLLERLGGEATVERLTASSGYHPSAVRKILGRLEGGGWVKVRRRASEQDRVFSRRSGAAAAQQVEDESAGKEDGQDS
jgi:DNA-binding MarR family transcriptional regulator